jgi:hypothetical protein
MCNGIGEPGIEIEKYMRGRVTRDEISCSKMTGSAYGKIIAHKFIDFEENLAALQVLNELNKAQ